jgi:hypothetical protein
MDTVGQTLPVLAQMFWKTVGYEVVGEIAWIPDTSSYVTL